MWIFGYGSIIWKPDFDYLERRPGYVTGWTRRFYQHSPDHRGVPGDPGRVATVLRAEDSECWGVAYRVPTGEGETIIDRLDRREQAGYERHEVEVVARGGDDRIESAHMYVAARENPNWAGPAPPEEVAEQVVDSEGPSGHNVEYVLELADALRALDAEDPHVFAIEREVRRRMDAG